MNKELILKSDLLDILFQDRNKAYGAYPLRKFYPTRLKKSLLVMFVSAGLLSAFTFLPSKKSNHVVFETDGATLGALKPEALPKPPKPKLPPQPQERRTTLFSTNIKIVDDKDSTKKLVDLSKVDIGNKSFDDVVVDIPGDLTGDLPGNEKTQEPAQIVPPELVKVGPIDNPDVQASYPGGQKELIRFLERNLRSPQDIDEGETIQVQVRFVVDFNGELQSFDVVKDGGDDFNKEVVRVLKKMPKWNPGKKGGQSIPVYYTIPVKFTSN